MSDIYDYMVRSVQVIRADKTLLTSFNRILSTSVGPERVRLLRAELERLEAPTDLQRLAALLENESIAAVFLKEINRAD